jgi:transposase, IS30 family
MMQKKYRRLSFDERIEIEKLLSHRKSYTDIATTLNRSKSTIQRDVIKQGTAQYKAMEAERLAVGKSSNRKSGKNKIKQCEPLEKYVLEKLMLRWSPRQISISLQKKFPENKAMQISHEAIYLYIYLHTKKELKNLLISELRQKRKYRGNVRRGADKRTTIQDPVRIDERPAEVMGRLIPGHWEGDLVMGKERLSAIGTLVERTTRTIIIVPLKARDATTVRKAFEKEFKSIPTQMKKTMTYDNGTEMAQHKLFTKNTKIQVYFTHPYSPWERPTNENSNGLIRDYFPAGTDFSTISKARLKEVQNQLNERPRHVLDYRTPKEVFDQIILASIN